MLADRFSPQLLSASQAFQDMQMHAMSRAAQPSAVSSGAASADSSACAAPFDLFHRNAASSTRSSIDSQEQQSAEPVGESAPSPPPSATYSASAAVSAAAAALSAFYSGSGLNRGQNTRGAPVLPVQLTIQPLDMTTSASELASSLGAFAPDTFRNFQWQANTATLAMSAFKLDCSPFAAGSGDATRRSLESSTSSPSMSKPIFSRPPQSANSGGCSSDDVQSWPAAAPRQSPPQQQQQPASPAPGAVAEQDSTASRAAIATANRRSAILRFRQKREQRSFDKKVRYVSRKRLAEARPRVRGQFVKAEVAAAYLAEQAAKQGVEVAASTAIAPMEVGVEC